MLDPNNDHWEYRARQAEAECERLQEALKRIAEEQNVVNDEGIVIQIRFREIARAALNE